MAHPTKTGAFTLSKTREFVGDKVFVARGVKKNCLKIGSIINNNNGSIIKRQTLKSSFFK